MRECTNSQGLGPWMSPNHIDLCGLVASMAQHPANLYYACPATIISLVAWPLRPGDRFVVTW